jgi:hypothetical protein
VAVCEAADAESIAADAAARYADRTRLEPTVFRFRAADGAGPFDGPIR